MLVVCSGQEVIDDYIKVFGKVVDEVVVRGLCSGFLNLIKVDFKNLNLVIALQVTKFFFLFTKNTYLLCSF